MSINATLERYANCRFRAHMDSIIPRRVPSRCRETLLFWYDHDGGPAVRAVMTLETEGDRITRARNYLFNADVIAEVCGEIGVRDRVNGYRYWPEQQGTASTTSKGSEPS